MKCILFTRLINQRQNLGFMPGKKVHSKENMLVVMGVVELGDRGRQEIESACLCLLCSLT